MHTKGARFNQAACWPGAARRPALRLFRPGQGGRFAAPRPGPQAEDDQRSGFEQDAVAGRTGRGLRRILLSIEVSRPVVIDRLGGNGQHRDAGKHGEDRHEKEHGALRECIANTARHHGDGDIARMVKGMRCRDRAVPHSAAARPARRGRGSRGRSGRRHRCVLRPGPAMLRQRIRLCLERCGTPSGGRARRPAGRGARPGEDVPPLWIPAVAALSPSRFAPGR
jgi:hypothetical protein